MSDNHGFCDVEAMSAVPAKEGHTEKETIQRKASDDLLYKIDDVPPWYTCCFLGLQHYLTMFGSTVSIPFILCPLLCVREDDPARGYIISTIFFVSGLVTLLQSTFGCRLPIIQGGTFSFLVPTIAILSLPELQCPTGLMDGTSEFSSEEKEEIWHIRMREIQGAICVASIFQLVIGYTGLIGLMLRYITPLTITPSVTMIGVSLFGAASHNCQGNWGVAILTIVVMTLCSQYLRNITIPLPLWKDGKMTVSPVPVFKLFPILITILVMWGFCAILTVSGAISEDNGARTDRNLELVYKAAWFRFPYPFQWGVPTVSAAGVFGMVAGVLASAIESVGDYYACARLSGAPPPPVHAINRGIGTEGLGCILAGLWGTGNGTTSYSENIGAIGVTKVGSRRVIQWGAAIMLGFGMFSKFGSCFLTIPTPIVGGIFCVMFGMIAAVGLSNLQFVDLNSTRNLFVLGFSIFFSLVVPQWMKQNPGLVLTGSDEVDQILKVLLETSMFVGGFLGFFLDNTIPGSPEERGLIAWNAQHGVTDTDEGADFQAKCYDLPLGMDFLRSQKWAQYVPFLPTFKKNK
eukprot:TRINITY_DN16685_c0_g1_i3.p1 TRINITY_DN16685_c0_g1~~TRINITY_DN16685_c0_g1_i3.p1  ORF type:complete len:575 (-),score=125.95 TRINITY_DN16685_c0_g1_i3:271-1995(-)